MDMFLHFLKKNKLLLTISVCICIGIIFGLLYSLDKYQKLEMNNTQTEITEENSSSNSSIYDKYIDNQTQIDKNDKNNNYNTKRSSNSINSTIYALNDFLFEVSQNIKEEELIAETKSGKQVYALLNYDTVDDLKLRLKDYVIDDNKVLNNVLNSFGFYIVKNRIGTLNEISQNVFWVNKGYGNNIIFSNESSAEVEVPMYQAGTTPISAPTTPTQVKPLTDSYGNKLGGEEDITTNNENTKQEYKYPGQTMIFKLTKDHGSWKVSSIEFKEK